MMYKLRTLYFRNPWRVVQLFSLVMFFVAFGLYVNRSLLTKRTVEEMMNNRGSSINFQPVAASNGYYMLFMGLVAFFTQLQLLHLLRYNKTIAVLGATLAQSGKDLLSFTVVTALVFLAFSMGAAQLFWKLNEYSSLRRTCSSMASAFLGKFDFYSIYNTYGMFGAYYLLLYLDVMIFLMVNIFIAIINEFLAKVSSDDTYVPDDHEVVDHFIGILNNFIFSKRQTTKASGAPLERGKPIEDVKPTKENNKEVHRACEDLLDRIGVLGQVAEACSPDERVDIVDIFIMYTSSPTPGDLPSDGGGQYESSTADKDPDVVSTPAVLRPGGVLPQPRGGS